MEMAEIENTDVETEALSPEAQLESVLFVATEPLTAHRLATVLDTTQTQVEHVLGALGQRYRGRGLRLQWTRDGVQLTTAPAASAVIERFLGLEMTTRLSQAALEVLAIVAYMQPVTRPQIDEIRGVNSDGALRTLLGKGMVEELGRMETPGRPILYGTTIEFLQYFGLTSVDELPPLAADEEEE